MTEAIRFGVILTLIGKFAAICSSDLPVFQQPVDSFVSQPRFLTAEKVHSVEIGGSLSLYCRVLNLSSHHTVSWLRVSDVQVLTVGGFVFSSDPRISITVEMGQWRTAGVWILRMSSVTSADSGVYQCQINTDPALVQEVLVLVTSNHTDTLSTPGSENSIDVEGSSDVTGDENNDDEIEDIDSVADSSDENSDTRDNFYFNDTSDNETLGLVNTSDIYSDSEDTINSTEKELFFLSNIVSNPKTDVGDTNPVNSTAIGKGKGLQKGTTTDNASGSLLIPLVSLLCVSTFILVLGTIRTLYMSPKSPTVVRRGTLDSRTLRTGRKGSDSRSSTSGSLRRGGKRRARFAEESEIYQIRGGERGELPPLIEVIESTPPARDRLFHTEIQSSDSDSTTAPPRKFSRPRGGKKPAKTQHHKHMQLSDYSDYSDTSIRTEEDEAHAARLQGHGGRYGVEGGDEDGTRLSPYYQPGRGLQKSKLLASEETLYGELVLSDHPSVVGNVGTHGSSGNQGLPGSPGRPASTRSVGNGGRTGSKEKVRKPAANPCLIEHRSTRECRPGTTRRIHFNPFEEYSEYSD